MRDESPSLTAGFVSAARHLGQLLPDEARLVDDPYGTSFVSPTVSRWIDREHARLRPLGTLPGLGDWILYMQVRTRVIDDALRSFLTSGGRQVVLLGAGYDCRALRMPELADANIFEVDHPATQSHKRGILDRIGADSPATYVTWDFETQAMEELPDALATAGFDRADPAFTIWEGVTMYLTEPAIDSSLRAIRAYSTEGSRLAMTYFAKSRIAQPSMLTRAISAIVSTVGEPWRFGWEAGALPDYLRDRGFDLVRDISMSDAARELLPARYAARVRDPARRFAVAAAPESVAVGVRNRT